MEFQVSEILNENIVWGRNCGDSIRIGSCFNSVSVLEFPKSGAPAENRSLNSNCSLEVVGIEYTHTLCEELGNSYTGGLMFKPSNLEVIKVLLEGIDSHQYLVLTAE